MITTPLNWKKMIKAPSLTAKTEEQISQEYQQQIEQKSADDVPEEQVSDAVEAVSDKKDEAKLDQQPATQNKN